APVVVLTGPAPGAICEVTLAHWYMLRVPADAGGRVALPLRFDPATQTVSILNGPGEEMAVEALACGPAAGLHAAGRRLDFRTLAARAASRAANRAATLDVTAPLEVDCADLGCTAAR
ncbi:hypothetical protein, partial [Frigidibacter sp. MR17.24]|uniref:hypothetical protein n=1 Tax=Frigidibacter sp. MR17.24 TaxID=3127345 RepID=UPI003012B5F5